MSLPTQISSHSWLIIIQPWSCIVSRGIAFRIIHLLISTRLLQKIKKGSYKNSEAVKSERKNFSRQTYRSVRILYILLKNILRQNIKNLKFVSFKIVHQLITFAWAVHVNAILTLYMHFNPLFCFLLQSSWIRYHPVSTRIFKCASRKSFVADSSLT